MKERFATGENNEDDFPILGYTKDGAAVRDRRDSHFHSETGANFEILAAALKEIDTKDQNLVKSSVEFNEVIGMQTCVEVGPDDNIEMAFRLKRSGRTPLVHGRKAIPTKSLIVVLSKDASYPQGKNYTLLTSYPGEKSPREPWDPAICDPDELEAAEEFWANHAIIYDERIIDRERTEEFNNASKEEQDAELLRENIFYDGIFIDPDELYGKAPASLAKTIETPHVTTVFHPNKTEELHLASLGSGARIMAIGYGNDGKNEGLLVRVEADDPDVQAACDKLEVPHITLSIAEGAAAKDTANLEFTPLEEPIELFGRYGLWRHGEVVTKLDD